eukprot:scaffold4002_cov67-Phaeocystis_antarctica.AAC.3
MAPQRRPPAARERHGHVAHRGDGCARRCEEGREQPALQLVEVDAHAPRARVRAQRRAHRSTPRVGGRGRRAGARVGEGIGERERLGRGGVCVITDGDDTAARAVEPRHEDVTVAAELQLRGVAELLQHCRRSGHQLLTLLTEGGHVERVGQRVAAARRAAVGTGYPAGRYTGVVEAHRVVECRYLGVERRPPRAACGQEAQRARGAGASMDLRGP